MDIVYPYKAVPADFALRYSLRSLVNVPHDRVVIAGDRPGITSGRVLYARGPKIAARYQSSTANLVAAIDQAGVSGDFILMHDDIFILEPWTFRHENRGTIDEYLSGGHAVGSYRRHAEETRKILRAEGIGDPLFFGLHTPTVYNAQRLLDVVREYEGRKYLLRTLYHNLFPQPSVRREDVKAWRWPAETSDVLSISDRLAEDRDFRRWIEDRFPHRSDYEMESAPVRKTLTATRSMTYATRRLKAGDEFTASRRDADLLVRIGRAEYAAPKPPVDELAEVRREYERVVGKRAYHGWDADTLRDKIAQVQG